jgi:hypothetical protein
LKVYDGIGRDVTTLVDEMKDAGVHSVTFNASTFASGLYFYQLRAGNYFETRKMMLLE